MTTSHFSYVKGSGIALDPFAIPAERHPVNGYDIFTLDPRTPPDGTTHEEWRATLSHTYDYLLSLRTRPDLPEATTARIDQLLADIARTII
ncbi:hypothetical protein [Streptomyces sp. NPDC058441]|uniref:hypothetical protein n=1 Tax=Streptomyces sp. NPDC058441 TaxID=3346502 RepID=UPI003667F9B7